MALGAKLINMSKRAVNVFWEPHTLDYEKGNAMLIRHLPAFSAKGTSSFPGHSFVFAWEDGTFIKRTIIDPADGNLHPFDPYLIPNDEEETRRTIARELSQDEQALYWRMEQYLAL